MMLNISLNSWLYETEGTKGKQTMVQWSPKCIFLTTTLYCPPVEYTFWGILEPHNRERCPSLFLLSSPVGGEGQWKIPAAREHSSVLIAEAAAVLCYDRVLSVSKRWGESGPLGLAAPLPLLIFLCCDREGSGRRESGGISNVICTNRY